MPLPSNLEDVQREVIKYVEEFNLDPFPVIFELCDFDQLYEIASYGGFPTRYPHWRFGMIYDHLSKGYKYGLQKIYEMVINHDPCYAYLLKSNDIVDQKLVMAHVYAHSDFFKNNALFQSTNRKILEKMANHSTKVRELSDRFGIDRVEGFIDVCLTIENLIDPYVTGNYEAYCNSEEKSRHPEATFRHPEAQPRHPEAQPKDLSQIIRTKNETIEKLPKERDVVRFVIDNAELEDWEIEILSMIREESYYFAPQTMTKIMNEGWASYWHSKIMTERALKNKEVIDYAEHHAGTLAIIPGQINPYKLGLELFRDIEERWDRGKFGKEFDECGSYDERQKWNLRRGLGREKIFEVRKIYHDVSFIDTFLTEDFCFKQKYFTYSYNRRSGRYEVIDRDWKKVKEKMLFGLTNLGRPIIYVIDGNFEGKKELLLSHAHIGVDLKIDEAKDALAAVHKIWKKPVHIVTEVSGQKKLLTFTGEEHRERNI